MMFSGPEEKQVPKYSGCRLRLPSAGFGLIYENLAA